MIPLYKSELEIPGLAEKIQANCSIAFCSKVSEIEKTEKNNVILAALKNFSSKASIQDVDLFYTRSILVTTTWNKNDDVFTKEPVWAAKNTPSHKRTNIEHDEKQIVGHMTDVIAIDNDGNVIPDSTPIDDVPEIFHLLNGAVIYTYWEDEKYKEKVVELINSISEGSMYVSMECLFSNFAYAVKKDGKYYTIARDKDSAFLTKHLRAYGGTGEYEGAKIGRIPINIVFSGKGYVKQPANENSIILGEDYDISDISFTSAKLNSVFTEESGVINISASLNETENITNMNEQEIKDLQTKLANTEAIVADLTAKLETANTSKASIEEVKTKVDAEVVALKAQVAELTIAKQTAEQALAIATAEKIAVSRASLLVKKGFTEEEAKAKVSILASLSDEQFAVVAAEMNKVPAKTEETKATIEDTVTETVLDNVKVEEIPTDVTSVSSPDNAETVKATKEALRLAIASRFGFKTKESTKE